MKKFIVILILLIITISIIVHRSKSKPRLYVFNWTDYIDRDLVRKFEKLHKCKVVYDHYGSNEDMHTKLMTSKAAYDIVVPSGYYISVLLEEDLLDEIDFTLLTNYKNLDDAVLQMTKEYDFPKGFVVPYFWGTSGIVYNRKYLSDERMTDISWNILADENYTGKQMMTLPNDMREVIGVALMHNGYDPNDTSDEALTKARETVLQWDKNVSQYNTDSWKNGVQDGTIWLAMAYNGDALQVMEENQDIGFVLPIEGSTLWIDFLAIPKNAENKELAHKFIDFLLEEQVALANTEYVMYATPNKAAFNLLDPEVKENTDIYLTEEYIAKSHHIKHLGRDDMEKINTIWDEIKNN